MNTTWKLVMYFSLSLEWVGGLVTIPNYGDVLWARHKRGTSVLVHKMSPDFGRTVNFVCHLFFSEQFHQSHGHLFRAAHLLLVKSMEIYLSRKNI